MTVLNPSPISSKIFSMSDKNTMVAEISSFGPSFSLSRVYDDACDEGFSVVSERTGKTAVFAFDGKYKSREGEVLGDVFVCVSEGLKYLKAIVFND